MSLGYQSMCSITIYLLDKMASWFGGQDMIEVYNNVWCKECNREVQCKEKMYHCNMCPDFDICQNCENRGRSKHVDPSHTFRKVKFAGAPSGSF